VFHWSHRDRQTDRQRGQQCKACAQDRVSSYDHLMLGYRYRSITSNTVYPRYNLPVKSKKLMLPKNRPWMPMGVLPVRYENHLQGKLSPWRALRVNRCVPVSMNIIYIQKSKVILVAGHRACRGLTCWGFHTVWTTGLHMAVRLSACCVDRSLLTRNLFLLPLIHSVRGWVNCKA
jgi:hypothetical protein